MASDILVGAEQGKLGCAIYGKTTADVKISSAVRTQTTHGTCFDSSQVCARRPLIENNRTRDGPRASKHGIGIHRSKATARQNAVNDESPANLRRIYGVYGCAYGCRPRISTVGRDCRGRSPGLNKRTNARVKRTVQRYRGGARKGQIITTRDGGSRIDRQSTGRSRIRDQRISRKIDYTRHPYCTSHIIDRRGTSITQSAKRKVLGKVRHDTAELQGAVRDNRLITCTCRHAQTSLRRYLESTICNPHDARIVVVSAQCNSPNGGLVHGI